MPTTRGGKQSIVANPSNINYEHEPHTALIVCLVVVGTWLVRGLLYVHT